MEIPKTLVGASNTEMVESLIVPDYNSKNKRDDRKREEATRQHMQDSQKYMNNGLLQKSEGTVGVACNGGKLEYLGMCNRNKRQQCESKRVGEKIDDGPSCDQLCVQQKKH